jgi:parallel beta-helix repeat protein
MLVESCSKILIVDNIVTNYSGSIVLSSSTNCSIIGNGFYGNYDVGLYISNSSTYIAYNNFTGNQATRYSYAGLSGFIRESTITQNSFSNCWIGLSFNHESKNNKISENNFIDNEMGVYFYPPSADRGINNLLLHNYWEDNRRDVGNADKYNPVDSKPLSSPVSTFTETYPYPMDMQTITDLNSALTDAQTNTVLPDSSPTATTFPKVLIVVSVLISTVIVIGGLLIYFKKHKHQHT